MNTCVERAYPVSVGDAVDTIFILIYTYVYACMKRYMYISIDVDMNINTCVQHAQPVGVRDASDSWWKSERLYWFSGSPTILPRDQGW